MQRGHRVLLLLGVLLLCLCDALALAQEMTLREALERALAKNPEIEKARLSLALAQSALREAREDTFSPTIAVKERVTLFGTSPGGLSLELGDTISFDATLWEEARVNLEKRQRSFQATCEEVKRKVITSYLEVLRREQDLALAEKNLEFYREKLKALQEAYGKGEGSSFSLKELEGKYREAATTVLHLKAQVRLSREAFFALLGEDEDSNLPFAPLPEFSLPLPEEEKLRDFVASSDTIEDLEGEWRVLEASLSRIRKESRPRVSLEGTYAEGDWSFSLSYDISQKSLDIALGKSLAPSVSASENFGLGLVLLWNFSPSVVEKKKQAELQRDILRIELEEAKRDVLFDLRKKYLAVLEAKDVLESKSILLEAQKEVYEARKKQYDLGVLDRLTLLESELGMLSAQNAYENARYDLLEKILDFLRAVEEPISWESLFSSQGGEVR